MSLVLIDEDDAAILRGIDMSRRHERYDVLTATEGEVGYRLAREKKPDLLIMDLMLPQMNGAKLSEMKVSSRSWRWDCSCAKPSIQRRFSTKIATKREESLT